MGVVQLMPTEEPAAAPVFDDFWTLWPQARRIEKKAAREQWARMSADQRMAAVVAVAAWRRIWANTDPAYIMHPHRWLQRERWEDEVPIDGVSSASHVSAKLPEGGERAAMPENVRALLAKLRK